MDAATLFALIKAKQEEFVENVEVLFVQAQGGVIRPLEVGS